MKAASHLAQSRKFHPRLSMMSQYQSAGALLLLPATPLTHPPAQHRGPDETPLTFTFRLSKM